MKIFFDFEFTALSQNASPISLGMISEDGRQFYAEFMDYDREQVSPWVKENVLPKLRLQELDGLPVLKAPSIWQIIGTRRQVEILLRDWLSQFDRVEMWGDVLAYDWILFLELFEGDPERKLPRNVFYIPFDISTLMKSKGIDPDIDRETFSGLSLLDKHNALDDARMIRECYRRIASHMETIILSARIEYPAGNNFFLAATPFVVSSSKDLEKRVAEWRAQYERDGYRIDDVIFTALPS